MSKIQYDLKCDIAQTLNLIGDRWTLLIILNIGRGYNKFNELQEILKGIPTNLLAARLKELKEMDLLVSKQYQDKPKRFSYHLTEKAISLNMLFYSIVEWANKYQSHCYSELVDKKTGEKIKIKVISEKSGEELNYEDVEIKHVNVN